MAWPRWWSERRAWRRRSRGKQLPRWARPGNNGTVKIDGVEFDTHPDNEPHVGCVFQVDWYGFDEGDLFSHVTFEVHPPTGKR